MVRFKLERNTQAPVRKEMPRRFKWDLPLDTLEPGDGIVLYYSPQEAKRKLNAVRSHVCRRQKEFDYNLSVFQHQDGILIWRRGEEE